jgi:hypothetical protein
MHNSYSKQGTSSISFSNVSVDNCATFINGIVIGKSNSRHWTGILTRSSGLINSAKKDKYANLDRFLSEKQCIIRIQNRNELCCARALVTGKARLNKTENGDGIRKGYTIRALHHQANVPMRKCGIDDVKLFQKVMNDVQMDVGHR